MSDQPAIRHVSDTALWVAVYRAMESEREDALFHDPFARRLAGERGTQIVNELPRAKSYSWPMVVRTQVLDELILDALERDGYDTVLNLAAGLDTRPYRLALPASLRWIEADLPEMIEYKNTALKEVRAFCRLERHAVDLADQSARCALFARVSAAANRVLVITEGLLIYLGADQVKALAVDLHQQAPFKRWLTDLISPRTLGIMRRYYGKKHTASNVRFQFAPAEHVEFFRPLGWKPAAFHSMWDEAKRLKRREVPFAWLVQAQLALMPGKREEVRRMGGMAVLERE